MARDAWHSPRYVGETEKFGRLSISETILINTNSLILESSAHKHAYAARHHEEMFPVLTAETSKSVDVLESDAFLAGLFVTVRIVNLSSDS